MFTADKNTIHPRHTDSGDFRLDSLPENLNIVRIDDIVPIPDSQHAVTNTNSK